MRNYKLINAIMCEDIRREENGKHILIGVYGGDILVADLPGNIRLAVYLEMEFAEPGDCQIDLVINLPGKGFVKLESHASPTREGPVLLLATPAFGAAIQQEGVLVVKMSVDGGRSRTVAKKKISIKKSLTSAIS